MARTREITFEQLIKSFTSNFNGSSVQRISEEQLRELNLYDEVFRIYKSLGGVLNEIPLRFGDFDFIIDNKIIELDEEAHFNRYRGVTLSSNIYNTNKCFSIENYQKYCKVHESDCIKGRSFGGYWTNESTEKQFGKANSNGNLEDNGSPRWKQRAFYDYLKDLIPIVYSIPLIRISIYDLIKDNSGYTYTVNQILENYDKLRMKFIYDKITSIE